MNGFNKVIIAGNLTRDPELRYTSSGRAVSRISVAVNRQWRDPETNEKKEEVTFVDVDVWGKQAEVIGQYLKKGRPILIEGRLKMDTWEDKQTQQKRSRLGVVLESFNFLDSGNAREGGGGDFNSAAPRSRSAASSAPAPSASSAGSDPDALPPEEDDVPF